MKCIPSPEPALPLGRRSLIVTLGSVMEPESDVSRQKMTAMQCGSCGELSSAGSRFCRNCGTSLASAEAIVAARPPLVVAGELKQVTVLFADLVNSTAIVALLDPETAMQRLDPLLRIMCGVVEDFGGIVANTMGDGIMALFGAPLAHEGHAVLGCQAALSMRDALQAFSGGYAMRGALHSGEIVANAPTRGPEQSGAYGMTLHVASRLPAQVEPNQICVSDACYRLIRRVAEVEPLGLHTLRGVPNPVPLYALRGLRPASVRRGPVEQGLTPLLGRQNELMMLKTTLRAAAAGAGSVVGITGAPGTGKSRLCHEFGALCRERLVPIFEARAQPYGSAMPLRPIVELLRAAYFGLSADDVSPHAGVRIAERLAEVEGTEHADVASFCSLLGVPAPAASASSLSPETRTAALLAIVQRLVRQRGATTMVLVLEDLHWLDEGSAMFLAALAEAVAETRTMLVVNFRQGYCAPWMGASNYHQVELGELTLTDTGRLMDELVGGDAELTDIKHRVAIRSAGNPFFAEELVRSLAEEDVLTGHAGAYRLGKQASADVLPATVHVVIGARIDRLDRADRRVLHIASILGKEFDAEVLGNIVGQAWSRLEAALDRLCAAGLLARKEHGGSAYRFRHPLIQEVAYATQLKATRIGLHATAADAMERACAHRLDQSAALIAYHLEHAGMTGRAAVFAARAARWVGLTSPRTAIQYWRNVRSLMADQPRSRENDALRIEASAQIAWLGWREGFSAEEAKPFLQEALAWAGEIDDSIIPLLMLVEGRMAQVNGGDCDRYVERVLDAIALAERAGDRGRVALLHAALSHAYGWAGLLGKALAANDAALANLDHVTHGDQRFLGYRVAHWTTALRGRLLARLGGFEDARVSFDNMIETKAAIDPTVLFIAHLGYVELAWSCESATIARHNASRIAALAEHQGSAYLRLYQLATDAIAHGVAGETDRAIRGIKAALLHQQQTGAAVEYEPEMLAYLSEYQLGAQAYADAVATAQTAIALARQRRNRLPECRALLTLANLALLSPALGGASAASAALRQAEQVMQETGAGIYQRRLECVRSLMLRTLGELKA